MLLKIGEIASPKTSLITGSHGQPIFQFKIKEGWNEHCPFRQMHVKFGHLLFILQQRESQKSNLNACCAKSDSISIVRYLTADLNSFTSMKKSSVTNF